MSRNSEINYTGLSPLLIMTGLNPSFPDPANDSLTTTNTVRNDDPYLSRFTALKVARMAAREVEAEEKVKKIMKSKAQPHNSICWEIGDKALFLL